uniref:Uncharacterized protein n=1 Tax=Spongospora subterranea TaxID=70186 RepID=A0A0H5RBB2_9EUKA|eukprot:CRZ11096.1 hypothetical protein [Spongospora subterranea]
MNVSVPSGVFSVDQVQTLFIADMESAIPQSDSVNVNSVVKLNVDRYGIDFTVTCKDLSYPVADSIAGQLLDVNSTLRQGIITRGVQGGFVPVKNDEKSPEGDGYEPVYAVVAVFVVAFVLVMALIKRCMPKQHQLVSTSVDARDLDPSFPKSPSQHSHAIRLPKFSAISQARRTSFEVPVNLKSHGLP